MSPNDGAQYSFADEYKGPPVTYDIPRAVPINVERIPVAAVVSQVPISGTMMSLPVVQPVLAPASKKKPFSAELDQVGSLKSTVSPTSVIAFERSSGEGDDSALELGTGTTVSPNSVIAENCGGGECSGSGAGVSLSGELSSSGALDFSNANFESGEFSDLASSSRALGSCSISLEHSQELLGGAGSSCTVEFSDSLRGLRESSGRNESGDLNDSNRPDWASNDSVLSFDYPSSRVSSIKAGDVNLASSSDVRRPQNVTFRDIQSEDDDDEEFSRDAPEVVPVKKREPRTKGKKGSCYRCFKGNRFTEKEVCVVCDAKYCSSCVLRAMGSMPEGRKCVTCIGYPIDEVKRLNLGKCSRMLKRLLNELEVRQIMKAEKFCDVNQLPPEYVCVNGTPLCHEELVLLQNSPNPPKKLKPGNYWYDKVSGLWGKEGQKPSRVISPHLNVGGPIKIDASNGNTQVYINGREITKVELRMLQLAGVQCAGNPHFWVNEDGSYQEEGQKNTKGFIWGKAGTKLVCAVLSLPVPSKSITPSGELLNTPVSRSMPDYFEHSALQKILLVGYNGSGTSTIFKQAKILYKEVPFPDDERESIKLRIQSNVYSYIATLLEGRERFEDECSAELRENRSSVIDSTGNSVVAEEKSKFSLHPRLKSFSDWVLKNMISGNLETVFPAASREYAPLVHELWNDPAIKATYKRRSELEMLPSVASYFLERAVDILSMDYEPSDLDILYAEGVTSSNGLASIDFSFPQSSSDDISDSGDQHDCLTRYQLIRVHARGLGENCKWLEMFEDVGLVIFCVSLSDYDQFSPDSDGSLTNKMMLAKRFFESLVTHPTFEQMDFHLVLNKFDLFEEKIERVPLSQCEWFDQFHPLLSKHRSTSNTDSINHSPSQGLIAFHYIGVKFKRLYSSLTGKKLYVSLARGLEPNSVDATLKYSREILKWEEERGNFGLSEYSAYSTEASSFSH